MLLIPSPESAKIFLRSINREARRLPDGSFAWVLLNSAGNELGRFHHWIDVWIFNLKWAASALNNEQEAKLFNRAYREAGLRKRQSMKGWISEFHSSVRARQSIDKLLRAKGHVIVTFDALPRGWKKRVQRIVASEMGSKGLLYRARVEMQRLDEQT